MSQANMIIESVVEQHAEEAAFLWLIRKLAVNRPHLELRDLAKLDERIEAHLDGLRVAGKPGWEIAKGQLADPGGPGEIFAAAVLAFEYGDAARIQDVLTTGSANLEAVRGLISSLGWLPYEQASKHIKSLLASADPTLNRVGIAASAIHRLSPGSSLTNAFASPEPLLKARALRAAGELGVADLQLTTRANLKSKNPACLFWAAWSTALLSKHKDALTVLQGIAESDSPFRERAAQTVARCLPVREAKAWIKRVVKELNRPRVAIVAIGALGDPDLVGWLIEQMKVDELARVAGESFSLITGCRIPYDQLERTKPEGFEAGPTDNPDDENVAMDPDENLPWPDANLVHKWWADHRGNFAKDTRYLLGRPIEKESLRHALKVGYQRQRIAAALELALLSPGRPLFETRAPAHRQIKMLG